MQPSEDQIAELLKEQALIREWVQHPAAKILANKLRSKAREALKRQLDADPYTQPDEIKRNQQLRFVLTVMLPKIIEECANYHPFTPDKKVEPKKRFSIMEWFRKG